MQKGVVQMIWYNILYFCSILFYCTSQTHFQMWAASLIVWDEGVKSFESNIILHLWQHSRKQLTVLKMRRLFKETADGRLINWTRTSRCHSRILLTHKTRANWLLVHQ